jgi:hypothetical protein
MYVCMYVMCETLSLILKENRSRVFGNRVLKEYFDPKRRKYQESEEFTDLYSSQNIGVMKCRRDWRGM